MVVRPGHLQAPVRLAVAPGARRAPAWDELGVEREEAGSVGPGDGSEDAAIWKAGGRDPGGAGDPFDSHPVAFGAHLGGDGAAGPAAELGARNGRPPYLRFRTIWSFVSAHFLSVLDSVLINLATRSMRIWSRS
jgi:hypothetical protein